MVSELRGITDSIHIVSPDIVEFTGDNPGKFRVGPHIGVRMGKIETMGKVNFFEVMAIRARLGKRQGRQFGEYVDVESSGRHHYAMTDPRPYLGAELGGPIDERTPLILPAAAQQKTNRMATAQAAFSAILAPPTMRAYDTALSDLPAVNTRLPKEHVYTPENYPSQELALCLIYDFMQHIRRHGTEIAV